MSWLQDEAGRKVKIDPLAVRRRRSTKQYILGFNDGFKNSFLLRWSGDWTVCLLEPGTFPGHYNQYLTCNICEGVLHFFACSLLNMHVEPVKRKLTLRLDQDEVIYIDNAGSRVLHQG